MYQFLLNLLGLNRNNKNSKTRTTRSFPSRKTLRHEPLEDRRMLATLTVSVNNDGAIAENDGNLTLREAIAYVNDQADPGPNDLVHIDLTEPFGVNDIILFDSSLDGSTITLTEGELLIRESVTIDATALTNGLTIDASGNDPTPTENNFDGSRVFTVQIPFNTNYEVKFRGLAFTGADASGDGGAIRFDHFGSSPGIATLNVEDCHFYDNYANRGGAIYANDGSLSLNQTLIENNEAEFEGGGVSLDGRTVSASIADSSFVGNRAKHNGGGLLVYLVSSNSGAAANVTVQGSEFRDNHALGTRFTGSGGYGGGIYADLRGDTIVGGEFVRPSLDINESTFVDNTSLRRGGGVWTCTKFGATFDLTNSNVSGNSTGDPESGNSEGEGGGLWVGLRTFETQETVSFDVTVDRVTVDNNDSEGEAGGIWLGHVGAANTVQFPTHDIFADFTHVTISGNEAKTVGGGMWIDWVRESAFAPEVGNIITDLRHSTIYNNRSPLGGGLHSGTDLPGKNIFTTLFHTIVSGNTQLDLATADNIAGAIEVGSSFNLIGPGMGTVNNPTNDPGLMPLANNGGFLLPDGSRILTHSLLAASPALDTGDASAVAGVGAIPEYDQRDNPFSRVVDGGSGTARIDIGAVELAPIEVPPTITDVRIDRRAPGDQWHPDAEVSFAERISTPTGSEQLRPIFTAGADTIEIVFSEGIDSIAQSDLKLLGLNGVEFPSSGVSHVSGSNVAMWTFNSIPDDKYAIHLSGQITDLAGNLLDGEWANPDNNTPDFFEDDVLDPEHKSSFETGNGMAGTEGEGFRFHFAILAGDYDGNGIVEATEAVTGDGDGDGDAIGDAGDVAIRDNNAGNLLPLRAVADADFNDDEIVNAVDLARWEANFGKSTVVTHSMGDANGDGKVDGIDLDLWEEQYGGSPHPQFSADFNGSGFVDGDDFLIWQVNHGRGYGDANGNDLVTSSDFLRWQSKFGLFSAWYVAPEMGPQALTVGSAPVVTDVIISGSASLHAPFSFDTVDGDGGQLATVPVGGADTISIVFSENVNVSASSLSIVGLTSANTPSLVEFVYDSATFTATWRFEGWIINGDNYLISLKDAVADVDGNLLDGEWTNPQSITTTNVLVSEFPSGDGTPGGNFDFVMTMLPGDADLDGDVDSTDLGILLTFWDPAGIDNFFTYGDFDGDGDVGPSDQGVLFMNWQSNLQNTIVLADLDGDFDVDNADMTTISDNFGMASPTLADGDLDEDGDIDQTDLDLAFAQFGIALNLAA